MAGVTIDGVTYYGSGSGDKNYPNPYYKTDHGLYSVIESQFNDYLQREGTVVADYWNPEQKYRCFFRRNKDTNQTNDNITIYYHVDVGIEPGSVITHYGKRYLILNQESIENRIYHRSDGINADILIQTYNAKTGEEIVLPAFAYDMTGSLVKNGDIMTISAGDTEFMASDNPVSRKLTINSEFEALGNFYKVVNVNYKTGICRIQASITQRHEEIEYNLHIADEPTHTQGDAKKLIAVATRNGNVVSNPTLVWSSSNPEIINIDEDGNALFVGIGTCAVSCLWQEHNVVDTAYIEVVAEQTSLRCEIDGPDEMYVGSEETYTAVFYTKDGRTVDTTVTPVWSLDLPKSLVNYVTITKQSGNDIVIKAAYGTQWETFGITLSDGTDRYNATKTIDIISWL